MPPAPQLFWRFPVLHLRSPAASPRVLVVTGTGKTLLAKAAATETGATFIELKVSDVVRGEVGESEKVRGR